MLAVPVVESEPNSDAKEWIQEREAHHEMLHKQLLIAQNKIKTQADKHRSDREFQVGDQVLLKLQTYAQQSVVNRPFPKLSMKYYGPYKVTECIGKAAYRLDLPSDAKVHPVFHVSQLKPYTPNYTPVFNTLPKLIDLEAEPVEPAEILERRLVKKGSSAVVQIRVCWTNLPPDATTWEDDNVLRARFPVALAWGQASSPAGGAITAQAEASGGHSGEGGATAN
jgi:hypothetical protein